jgi:hypothetical protein
MKHALDGSTYRNINEATPQRSKRPMIWPFRNRHRHTWTKWEQGQGTMTWPWGKKYKVAIQARRCTECGYLTCREL